MVRKKDEDSTEKFEKVRSRQLLAMTVTIWILVIVAVLSKRPDLPGHIEQGRASVLQVMAIAAFICFTAWNWRCPSCNKYLGADFRKKKCRKCGGALLR